MITVKVIQLLLALSILVLVHELGHFVFARLFGIRVSKFYLFMDPYFALFRYKPKGSHTEYGIGWLPFGGYCRIEGMVDESLVTDGLESAPEPWEFRSKPAWQRLLVMLGGILFNLLLAVVIYAGIAYTWGTNHLPMQQLGTHLTYSSVGHQMGLRDGDLPLRVDGEELHYFDGSVLQKIAEGRELVVLRDGAEVTLPVPVDLFEAMLQSDSALYSVQLPAVVDSIISGGHASQAGLMPHDRIVTVNAQPTADLMTAYELLQQSRGDSIQMTVERAGTLVPLHLMNDADHGIGITFQGPDSFFTEEHRSYSLLESVPQGIRSAVAQLQSYVGQLKYIATPTGISKVGGLGTMGSLFPGTWHWQSFWSIAAFLSVVLAVMNLLPIPALDGGHILFLLIEVITGRQVPVKWLVRFQIIGMALLLLLMVYANVSDIFRFL